MLIIYADSRDMKGVAARQAAAIKRGDPYDFPSLSNEKSGVPREGVRPFPGQPAARRGRRTAPQEWFDADWFQGRMAA